MKRTKKAQVYSFKAISSAPSEGSIGQSRKSSQQDQQSQSYSIQPQSESKPFQLSSVQYPNKIKEGIFRHERQYTNNQNEPQLKYEVSFRKPQFVNKANQSYQIQLHPKISLLDQEIQQNIKRRLQLQFELNQLKKIQEKDRKQAQLISYMNEDNKYYTSVGIEKDFALRNKETAFIDQLIMKGTLKPVTNGITRGISADKPQSKDIQKDRDEQLTKSIQILTDNHMQTILQKGLSGDKNPQTKKDFYDLKSFLGMNQRDSLNKNELSKNKKSSFKQASSPIPPPIAVIQQLLSRVTFPEIPKENVQKLYKKCQQLYAIHQSHSDLVFLMMLGCFHMQDHHGVRKYFKQILGFKKFELKAYWVAAQSQYVLQNYERCVKLTQFCMENLEDKFLPRFIYLKAKCYYEMDNFTNSIVCYNQLIRIKPKIPEYYLQRAVLYDKLGYQKQCKQDYLMFGIIKPEAKKYLQQKIMVEQNDGKRKELLQIYKKMV